MKPATEARTDCPSCERRGKPVKPITIESLLLPGRLERLGQLGGWRFCASSDCQTAYFHEATAEAVPKDDVRVRIGQKESSAPRTVCYCFGHTQEAIEAEAQAGGGSSVGDAITEQCRQGLDRCPETNPQGSCCLGNVRALESAAAELNVGGSDRLSAAPLSAARTTQAERAVALASLGALGSAILSSVCCWLPLLLLAFGVSAGSMAGFLEAYRPWLLGATGALLTAAFYLTYLRRPTCGPDGSCAAPPDRWIRFNKATLWIATTAVLTFALFPNYVGLLVGSEAAAPAETAAEEATLRTVTLEVTGMTCGTCEVHVRFALLEVPGVRSARVSFTEARAVVQIEPSVDPQALLAAVGTTGYEALIAKETE